MSKTTQSSGQANKPDLDISGLRVCIVSQYWEPDVLGDVSRLRQIVAILEDMGCRLTLVTTRPHYPSGDSKGYPFRLLRVEWKGRMRVLRLAMPPLPHKGFMNRLILYTWFSLFATIPAMLFGRKGVVWAFSQRVFSTYPALAPKVASGATVVSDVTDIWPEALGNTGYARPGSITYLVGRGLAAFAYRHSDALSTMIAPMKRVLIANYGVPEGRIFVLPYTWRVLKGKRGVRGPFTVLYYGNVGPNYDFKVIVEAAKILETSGVQFLVRGDGEGLQPLKDQVARANLGNFRLISRILPDDQLSELVSSADVLVLSTASHVYEDVSFPGKFVEYLYAAKPVAYVGRGLPAKLIRLHNLGATFAHGDSRGLSDFILRVKADPGLASLYSENSRRASTELFPMEALEASVRDLMHYVARRSAK